MDLAIGDSGGLDTATGPKRSPRGIVPRIPVNAGNPAGPLKQKFPCKISRSVTHTRKRAVHAPTTFRVVYRLRGDPVAGHRGSDVGFQIEDSLWNRPDVTEKCD